MKCLDDHHNYELEHFEHTESWQKLSFINKEPDPANPTGPLLTVHDGTTNEEVLKMLIHRMNGLLGKLYSHDGAEALFHLEKALERLERRTRDRKVRGVEGTMNP